MLDDPRPLAQIDVFTTDDIEAFIEASRARRPASELIKDAAGDRERRTVGDTGRWWRNSSVEQIAAARGTGGGPVAGHIRVIPIKALDAVTEEG